MNTNGDWNLKLTRRAVLGRAGALAMSMTLPRFGWSTVVEVQTWRHYTTCRFGQMHFRTSEPADGSGEGKTPLVCLHESPLSGWEFLEFQPVMAADRRVLCPDTAGYGASDGPANQPEIDEYAAALADALDFIGYGANGAGAVDVLGFHTGTIIACSLAIQRPDLVRRLVLPGTPYFPIKVREENRLKYGKPRPFDDPNYVGSSYREIVLGPPLGPQRDSALPIPLRHQSFADRLRSGTRSNFGFEAAFRYDLDRALATLSQPALLPALNEWLDEPTRQAAALIRNSELVERPDLTKHVWVLQPAQMADVIRPFLDGAPPHHSTSISQADNVLDESLQAEIDFSDGGTHYWREFVSNRYGQMHISSARPKTRINPPVVLFHQNPVSGGIFQELMQALSIDRTVHAPDTPGFGESDGPGSQPSITELAGAVAESLINLGYGPNGSGPVDVFGVEMGAFLATEVVRLMPDLVRRVVLCSVPYFPANDRSEIKSQFLDTYYFFSDPDYVDRLYKRVVVAGDTRLPFQRRLALFTYHMIAGPKGEWGDRATIAYDVDEGLGSISKPTLLMSFDDLLMQPTHAAQPLISKAEYKHLPGLSRLGFMSHPEKVAQTIREFLDQPS